MRKGILIMLLGLLALSAPMFGAIVIDFGDGGVTTGTITVNATTIVGTGISVEIMKVNEGSGFESINTFGACDAGDSSNADGSACLSFNIDKTTGIGTIQVVGGIDSKTGLYGTGGVVSAYGTNSTVLLNGTSDTFTWTFPGSDINVVASGLDTKDSGLLSDLGLGAFIGTNNWQINNGFSIAAQQVSASNVYDAFSTDIPNSPVPEPTSILLLGTVLFGVTHLIRRRTGKV